MWSKSACSETLLLAASCVMMVDHVTTHGRLWEPPSRASMWRLGFNSPVNYQDMELFCGGVGVQYDQNGGKCGVCGDPWNGPREHEAGGKYANGIIVRKYNVSQIINVIIDLTANHKGIFEFHLCPLDNAFQKATDECLAKYPLIELSSGQVKYPVPDIGYSGKIEIQLRLPTGLRCRACMLQWKYTAGNSWGVNPNGTGCIGCGNQEQFYGCADVAIGSDDVSAVNEPDRTPWFIEDETEWHFGVVRYPGNQTGNGAAHLYKNNHIFSCLFVSVINLFTVVLVTLATS